MSSSSSSRKPSASFSLSAFMFLFLCMGLGVLAMLGVSAEASVDVRSLRSPRSSDFPEDLSSSVKTDPAVAGATWHNMTTECKPNEMGGFAFSKESALSIIGYGDLGQTKFTEADTAQALASTFSSTDGVVTGEGCLRLSESLLTKTDNGLAVFLLGNSPLPEGVNLTAAIIIANDFVSGANPPHPGNTNPSTSGISKFKPVAISVFAIAASLLCVARTARHRKALKQKLVDAAADSYVALGDD